MSVKQIAKKHNVCLRSVYNYVGGHTNRKGSHKQSRRALYLDKTETEALLLCILEAECKMPKENRIIMNGLQDRLLDIADDLTVL